jgi:hypothetical protein
MLNDEVKYGKGKREDQRCNIIRKEHIKDKRNCDQNSMSINSPLVTSSNLGTATAERL